MDSLESFAAHLLASIQREINTDYESEGSVLMHCGQDKITVLLSAALRQSQDYANDLSKLCALSHEAMKLARHDPARSFAWRRLYTDAALVWSLLDILNDNPDAVRGEKYWTDIIGRLDTALIVAGAPGEGRSDLVVDIIQRIQATYLSFRPAPSDVVIPPAPEEARIENQQLLPSSSAPVPVLSDPPSISSFRSTYSRTPFILRQFAAEWPAVAERKAAKKAYLQGVSGRGRIVPVEIGSDYRTDDWIQRLMGWDGFLDYMFSDVETGQSGDNHGPSQRDVLYLAQHDLFKQFPLLREDVAVPDYVYACLPPPDHYPQYRPPGNDEELVLNAWIGPKNAASPAHTDPFYNFYTQVVGRKTVWLAPPTVSYALRRPCSGPSNAGSSSDHEHSIESELSGEEANGSMLTNTTHLDVFASASDLEREKKFMEVVVPQAMSAVLDEGDMLFFPPAWWHAFRSETTSFSVSMWF